MFCATTIIKLVLSFLKKNDKDKKYYQLILMVELFHHDPKGSK